MQLLQQRRARVLVDEVLQPHIRNIDVSTDAKGGDGLGLLLQSHQRRVRELATVADAEVLQRGTQLQHGGHHIVIHGQTARHVQASELRAALQHGQQVLGAHLGVAQRQRGAPRGEGAERKHGVREATRLAHVVDESLRAAREQLGRVGAVGARQALLAHEARGRLGDELEAQQAQLGDVAHAHGGG